MTAEDDHPLMAVLRDAAAGEFPPIDGRVEVLAPDRAGNRAVVAFTGHAYVLTERDAGDPVLRDADGFGGATDPEVLVALAGPAGWVGSLDVVLVRRAGGAGARGRALEPTDRFDDHPRVVRSRAHRQGVVVYGDERGFATVGAGLAGRIEVSVELVGAGAGAGVGRELLRAVLAARPADELVFAQVAPGNAASLRAFLACGFVPIGSEVLFRPG